MVTVIAAAGLDTLINRAAFHIRGGGGGDLSHISVIWFSTIMALFPLCLVMVRLYDGLFLLQLRKRLDVISHVVLVLIDPEHCLKTFIQLSCRCASTLMALYGRGKDIAAGLVLHHDCFGQTEACNRPAFPFVPLLSKQLLPCCKML
jgi:hypothetical protein